MDLWGRLFSIEKDNNEALYTSASTYTKLKAAFLQ